MAEIHHECGVVALYHFADRSPSPLAPSKDPDRLTRLVPRMLLDVQNRGQLSAGITAYNPQRKKLLDTYKDLGTVAEVFRLNHAAKFENLMRRYTGRAAIGHVRYATCGLDDRGSAQPFECPHGRKWKWFSFCFNGQLANFPELKDQLLTKTDYHLARDTDTEIIMHSLSFELRGATKPDLLQVFANLGEKFDGAYNIAFLNAMGDMVVARDPLGIRPLCYACDDGLFAAASESVALANLGFAQSSIQSLAPGTAVVIEAGRPPRFERFASSPHSAHCFFEWIYFANVASKLDDRSVYLTRTHLGEELARLETVPNDEDTIVVPVPDTGKAAAAAMAHQLGVPVLEGLMRNRYVGRTFIEGQDRAAKARRKYTPLPEVLEDKRVLLVEDTIVRSTTMKALLQEIRRRGRPREIHVRVACPPIVAPCFYGIDMSTADELFATRFWDGSDLSDATQERMAEELGADSLRYLPLDAVARAIGLGTERLCRACLTGDYPTAAGRELYTLALNQNGKNRGRTYEGNPNLAALERAGST
jgi:amidophosphoribosyltransferase